MRCPCGTGTGLAECCGPLLDGTRRAGTAEQLMRSRYTAYALGDETYLRASWHPGTRPRRLTFDVEWTGLRLLGRSGGTPFHDEGTVEFEATYTDAGTPGVLRENSRFVRENGQWFYVDEVS